MLVAGQRATFETREAQSNYQYHFNTMQPNTIESGILAHDTINGITDTQS